LDLRDSGRTGLLHKYWDRGRGAALARAVGLAGAWGRAAYSGRAGDGRADSAEYGAFWDRRAADPCTARRDGDESALQPGGDGLRGDNGQSYGARLAGAAFSRAPRAASCGSGAVDWRAAGSCRQYGWPGARQHSRARARARPEQAADHAQSRLRQQYLRPG